MSLLAWLITLLVLLLFPFAATGPGAASGSSPGSTPAEGSSSRRVTTADNGRTLTLAVGDEFLLALGEGAWTVQVSDPTVLARVPNIAMVRGAQGIYVAKRTGRVTLRASAPAAAPFRLTIVVT